MKTKLFPVFATFIFWLNTSLSAQSLIDWEWKQVTNISYSDLEYKDNFIYAAGTFTASSVTLGPTTYTNAGGNDIIIYKMDTLGNVIWSQHVGSSNNESLKSICVDDSGNVLVTGSMSGTLNVGSTTLTSLGGKDMLMIKLSPIGNVLLAKQTGTSGDDEGMDITTDYLNDIYMVGSKSTDTMSFASTTNTYGNAILKWTSAGTEVFMQYMRGPASGYAATGTTKLIKYSAFDSTVVICGGVSSGTNVAVGYQLCHSSNLGLTFFCNASAYGVKNAAYLCKIKIDGFLVKLKDLVGGSNSGISDVSVNPTNGDCYFAQSVNNMPLGSMWMTWNVANSTFTNISYLPINLMSSYSNSYTLCEPLKINYHNNSVYGNFYRQENSPLNECGSYFSAKLNLVTSVSEVKNLRLAQISLSNACVGFDGSFCVGNYKMIAKSCPTGCGSLIIQNPAPDVSVCEGESANLGVSLCEIAGGTPPYTYSWSPSTGLSATNISQPVVSGLSSTTTYILTVTDAANNVIYDTVQVNLIPNPVITCSSPPSPICAGDTITLTMNGGSYYKLWGWGFSQGTFNLSISKDTSVWISGYDSNWCESKVQVSLQTFKINAITSTPIVCKDGNATLLASSANSYVWQPGNLVGDSVVTPISSSTIYTVTGTNAAGCTATATTSVLLSSSVTASSATDTICQGNSVQLSATADGYYIGPQWAPSGYCVPSAINLGTGEVSLNNFKFHDLVNNNSGVEPNGYGDYTSIPYVTVEKGTTYYFQCQRLVINGYGLKYTIWIDYNRNGSFADPNELVYSTPYDFYNLTTQGSVTIPLNATHGMTRMRILGCRQFQNADPCFMNTFGEYEDYRINIVTKQSLSNYSWNPAIIPANGSQVIASPITNTTYTVTSTDYQGCTATSTVAIQVKDSSSSYSNISVCNNSLPYTWNGQNLTSAGNYTYLTTNANGCDSIAYLTFTVLPNATSNSSLSVCANQTPYLWNGQNLNASGTYSFVSSGANGCDSTAYLSFTVLPNATSNSSLSVCPNQTPYVWNGKNLSASGTYSFISTGANGCDSTAYLALTVLPNATSTNTLSICANQIPYVWNGQNLSVSGTYSFISNGVNGCDSTAYLALTVLPNATSTNTLSICANQIPYVWNGQNLSASGAYSFVSSGANGCDSTAYLTLTVLPNATSTNTLSICANQTPYVWNGQNLSASGTYSFVSSGANGCDSTAYLTFTVLPNATSTSSQSVCANQTPYVWNGQNLSASGTYSFVSSGANGCDSTAYLTLTVLPNATSTNTLTICANQIPYVWNGQNLSASGTYSFISTGVNGCDSTAYLTLTVLPNATSTNTLSICANQTPYVWNGQNLTTSGTYNYLTTNVNGCDSMANLNFVVHPLPSPTISWDGASLVTQNYFSSYQWYLNNTILVGAIDSWHSPTISADYFVQVIDSNGCVNTSAVNNFFGYLESKDGKVVVFPNPTSAMLYISFPENQTYHLLLADMNGRQMMEKINDGSTRFESLNLESLANGLYTLTIQGGIEIKTFKVRKF